MKTECIEKSLAFQALNQRDVVAKFDGGAITSDAGGLLLREVEGHTAVIERFAGCFKDYRNSDLIEHSVMELVAQRVYGLALGYEDLNDHDELRYDPLLAVLVGKVDPEGKHRKYARDRGKALAGKSTLNRLELTSADADGSARYKKIALDFAAVDRLLVEVFLQSYPHPPKEIILDLDATDDTLHGHQEGRFFHGYYGSYCYLPLYIFCGEHLLCARLRPSNIDGAKGSVEELQGIVTQIRQTWPDTQIIIRGDSGFCRENIMAWCESESVDYVLGLAKNSRLTAILAQELQQAKGSYEATGKATRAFKDFQYQTLKSWSRPRRVIGKAEHLAKGSNPRFIVTSLRTEKIAAQQLYEQTYCARGDMENRIKEQQLYLFADRTSTHTMHANQIRLYFSSIAYILMHTLRRLGLQNTDMEKAQCSTIRLKLLKIGAHIQITVRKIWLSLSQAYPYHKIFIQILKNLRQLKPHPV